MRSTHTRPRRRLALLALAATSTLTATAPAVDLPPGGAVALTGVAPPNGTVLRDVATPFAIVDTTTGDLLFRSNVHERVIALGNGTLSFQWRIFDTLVDVQGAADLVSVDSYGGLTTDVEYSPNAPGQHFPSLATRSGNGAQISYHFASAIHETEDSRVFYASTDATAFTVTGSMTITLETGESTTITVAEPVFDDTPPIAEIHEPDALSCSCDPVQIVGIADDPDGTFDEWILEYRAAANPSWSFLAQSFSPVPAPGGVLMNWATGALPQGYYFLRLTVYNTAGLQSNDVTIFFLDKTFDTLSFTTPSNIVVGGLVCPGGTVHDHCATQYMVEYAPDGGSFQHVDPGMPLYPGSKINQTFATWDSSTVADGSYTLRVTGLDDCNHTEAATQPIVVDNTAPVVEITSPANCTGVDGLVEVYGTVDDANLAGWSLQYTGGNQNNWVTIATGTDPVIDGLLGVWDTTALPACCHALRIVAADTAVLDCNPALHHVSEHIVAVSVGGSCIGDVDGNGIVDVNDLLIVIGAWGMCP